MESGFMKINDASQYTGIKKSNLYSRVERKEIPHYRIGRLILFRREELNAWMEGQKVDCIDVEKESARILMPLARSGRDIDGIVKKTIADLKEPVYTSSHGKSDRIKGLRKEAEYGAV